MIAVRVPDTAIPDTGKKKRKVSLFFFFFFLLGKLTSTSRAFFFQVGMNVIRQPKNQVRITPRQNNRL